MRTRTQFVRKDRWCTLEKCWNRSLTLVLYAPANARIRVRYGLGWMSVSSQNQVLDGHTPRILVIGPLSIFFARAEILATGEDYVEYHLKIPGWHFSGKQHQTIDE